MTVGAVISSTAPYRDEFAEGERVLGKFILPPFQRPPVWNREQQVRLVESIWLELPIGIYIYNQISTPLNHPCDGWLIDGQQRVTAILEYVNDTFSVFGYKYSELDRREQRAFEMKSFPCVILEMTDSNELEEIYMRLAYGGTPHDPI